MVFDNVLETNNDINIPNKITIITANVETIEAVIPEKLTATNIVEIVIKKGNLPLQGTNAFVKIAIKRSRGESIILQPQTPAALQPKPIHMGMTMW